MTKFISNPHLRATYYAQAVHALDALTQDARDRDNEGDPTAYTELVYLGFARVKLLTAEGISMGEIKVKIDKEED